MQECKKKKTLCPANIEFQLIPAVCIFFFFLLCLFCLVNSLGNDHSALLMVLIKVKKPLISALEALNAN